jgi:hypothetical protein
MDQTEMLVGLAGYGVGLAGFAAIILAVAQRDGDRARQLPGFIPDVLANSLGGAWGSLVVLGVAAFEVEPPHLWRIASGVYLVPALAFTTLSVRHERRLDASEGGGRLARGAAAPRIKTIADWAFVGTHYACHLVNCLSFPFDPSFGIYFLANLILLSAATFMFGVLVFALLGEPAV